MTRAINKLSARGVASYLSNPGKRGSRLSDGGGLYLFYSPSGSFSWTFRYTRNRRAREIGLGPVQDVTLASAREKAAEMRTLLADDKDPLVIKREKQARELFRTSAENYYNRFSPTWKTERTRNAWQKNINVHCKSILDVKSKDVSLEHVLQVLNEIWHETPTVAVNVHSAIKRVMDFAAVTGQRDPNSANPADWDKLKLLLPKTHKTTHFSAMPYDDVPEFYRSLDTQRVASTAQAYRLIILTVLRKTEVLCLHWADVDFDKALITIPGERMKSGREHIVPMSQHVTDLLQEQRAISGDRKLVFPSRRGDKPLSSTLFVRFKSGFTVHGFRSSFRDYVADKTEHAREHIEECLSHAVGDTTERSYRRGTAIEKRRLIMNDWAEFVLGE